MRSCKSQLPETHPSLSDHIPVCLSLFSAKILFHFIYLFLFSSLQLTLFSSILGKRLHSLALPSVRASLIRTPQTRNPPIMTTTGFFFGGGGLDPSLPDRLLSVPSWAIEWGRAVGFPPRGTGICPAPWLPAGRFASARFGLLFFFSCAPALPFCYCISVISSLMARQQLRATRLHS